MGITIAKVISFPDKQGAESMNHYTYSLGIKAKTSRAEHIKLMFLQKAFLFLGTIPRNMLPEQHDEALNTTLSFEIGENSYTEEMDLVKALGKEPIYELRLDLDRPHWCFRATFFPKYMGGELYYCFVYPFEKIAGYADPTNGFRDDTYAVFEELRFNESEYVQYFINE